MAEKVFKSAGVFATETDLSRPTAAGPTGIPAGIIGTAVTGPAFVPITVGSFSDFRRVFGDTDGEKFGPLAVYTFLQQASALTYLRVLGAGDGLKRSASTGKVNRAGFTVGEKMVQANGLVEANPYAVAAGDEGRTAFLGCFMSSSQGSKIFSEAGIQTKVMGDHAIPIIRGVLLAPSGVILQLSGNHIGGIGGSSNKPSSTAAAVKGAATIRGSATGSVNPSSGDFVLLLNGHISTDSYPNVISASFKLGDNYFANKLNKDFSKIQEAGHYLYSHYDVNSSFAHVTGSGIIRADLISPEPGAYQTHTALEDIGFILTGSGLRNASTTGVTPNYESFEDRFTTAKSPFFISQDYGGTKHNLFRVCARGDGQAPSSKYKISIQNINPAAEVATDQFGTFDLMVREFTDSDQAPAILEAHVGLTMDPSSEKYIGRVIGDQRVFFDFDQAVGSQKLVVEGNHAGNSSLIRVEIPKAVDLGYVPDAALPLGFRGPDHLVTSGSGPLTSFSENISTMQTLAVTDSIWKRAVVLPLRYRADVKLGSSATSATIHDVAADPSLYWGVQFRMRDPDNLIENGFGVTELRSLNSAAATFDASMESRTKYFPNFDPISFKFSVGNNPGVADVNGTILDCDRFNNNIFTLERVRVLTSSADLGVTDGGADTEFWHSASYIRDGNIAAGDKGMRALKVSDLRISANRQYGKYTCILQGGFDGTNIFNDAQRKLDTTACKREMDDATNQGGTSGATVATYRKAIDMMGVKADVDINLLAIPGIRNAGVTDYAINAVESRFDALYVMDIEQRGEDNQVMTGSKDSDGVLIVPSISNTTSGFASRGLDTSFAAAYYPDVYITDPIELGTVMAPASVAVMGVMAQNDKIGRPWFAPAGYSRGKLDSSITGTALSLERSDLNRLYETNINPLASFAGGKPVVWGQKTLQANASALDRVNVRRLLIDVRRKVKNIANSLLFEPNRQETLDKFNALVKPVMQTIQAQQGVDRFKVIIDTTTTTQADVENNTIRGKIYLQPTRTAEFIALDFTVTNAGNFDSV